jgi:hypothetical protein
VRLTDNPTVSNALSSRWAAGDKDQARQAEGHRRQRVYNLAVNRYGGANLFSIRPLWKKSLDGGGPPSYLSPDPTIQLWQAMQRLEAGEVAASAVRRVRNYRMHHYLV